MGSSILSGAADRISMAFFLVILGEIGLKIFFFVTISMDSNFRGISKLFFPVSRRN